VPGWSIANKMQSFEKTRTSSPSFPAIDWEQPDLPDPCSGTSLGFMLGQIVSEGAGSSVSPGRQGAGAQAHIPIGPIRVVLRRLCRSLMHSTEEAQSSDRQFRSVFGCFRAVDDA